LPAPFDAVSLDAPADRPRALLELAEGALDLLILRGALPAETLPGVVRAVEALGGDAPWTLQMSEDPAVPQMRLLGSSLTPYVGFPDGPPLEHYLSVADAFRGLVGPLFEAFGGLEARVNALLGALSGGLPVAPPLSADGRAYTPATVRQLPPGVGIPLHVGESFLQTGGYRELAPRLRPDLQLSWFFTLAPAAEGGELVVHDLTWGDPRTPWRQDRVVDEDALVERFPARRFKPGAGDLLIFNGGRYWHSVSPVGGANPRYTLGGFIGFSRDMTRLWYWN
jgi:hypothetical protein